MKSIHKHIVGRHTPRSGRVREREKHSISDDPFSIGNRGRKWAARRPHLAGSLEQTLNFIEAISQVVVRVKLA